VELHLHLEGALPLEALWKLVQKYDPGSLSSIDALRQRFTYRDFPHFLETWVWKNQYLRSYEDFTLLASATARDLARQNVRYAEIFFSPNDFARHGLTASGLAQAIRSRFARVPRIDLALVADLVRSTPIDEAQRLLDELYECRAQGILGIGIGGAERSYPPEPFAPVYQRARQLGFHTTAHAGEGAGAQSIWGAVRALSAERIGHATRAWEDPSLVETLRQRQIPLEMCPLSNLRTAVVPALRDHPIRRYFDLGLLVTVNTDDPMMFNNSLAAEYRQLVEQLDFTPAEIHALILNAVRASWLPEERKRSLRKQLESDPAWALPA
jgi:adenosine deaminase